LIFKQTAAPTGWTKVLTNNDSALRVVTGTASTGGSVAFTTAFASKAVTGTNAASGAYTLATAEMPAHTHNLNYSTNFSGSSRVLRTDGSSGLFATTSTGGGGSHSHSAAAFTGTAINLAVAYVDVIVATKD
jgi:microcystin-dependent protein